MNNNTSSPINTYNKCNYLFPYFPNLESRLGGKQAGKLQLYEYKVFRKCLDLD
jgi:hypothetical protein